MRDLGSSLLNVVGTVSVESNECGASKDVGDSVGGERVEVGSSVGSANEVGVAAESVFDVVSCELRSLESEVLASESLFDDEFSRDSEEDQSEEECQPAELSVLLDVADEE